MSRVAVFTYGSLVSAESAARTLGRSVSPSRPLRLRGWRRRWSQFRDNLRCEKTFALPDGTLPAHVLGLNVERADDDDDHDDDEIGAPNGVLIELDPDELARLDVREMRYERVEVSAEVDPAAGFDRVFTYTAREAHFAPDPPHDAVILASYARAVESAFASLGGDQRRLYVETTAAPLAEVVEAELVRDRIPPGNPREW